jgi:nitroreductase
MDSLSEAFDSIVQSRRSTRFFDTSKKIDTTSVTRSLRRALLAPNSSNMQLWQFIRIRSKGPLSKIAEYCFNQPAAKNAHELVIFVCRRDLWKKSQRFNLDALEEQNFKDKKTALAYKNYYERLIPLLYYNDPLGIIGFLRKIWITIKGVKYPTYREVYASDIDTTIHKSCALAAQTFMLSLASEKLASCPMEGFDSKRIKKYLKLPKSSQINMIIAVGPPSSDGIYGPRRRIDLDKISYEV